MTGATGRTTLTFAVVEPCPLPHICQVLADVGPFVCTGVPPGIVTEVMLRLLLS